MLDRPFRLWVFVVLGALGCAADVDESALPLPDLGPTVDAGARLVPVTLQLVDQVYGRPAPGPLQVRVTPLGGLDRRLIEVERDGDGGWPAEIEVQLPPGPVELTAFVDRDSDGLFDGCPFPPTAADPLGADSLDNHHGRWQGEIAAGQTVPLTIERRLCGPGDAATGLTGVVRPPEGAPQVGAPVYAQLVQAVAEGETAPAPVVLPLFPDGLTGITPFAVGELVPGQYALTLFSDDDGDQLPTPCGPELSGGDRLVARYPVGGGTVQVEAGRRTEVTVDLTVPAGCPETLTGLSFDVALAPGLEAALADMPVEGLLDGPLRLALLPPAGGGAAAAVTLAVRAGDLPRRITVTGLPDGLWRVAVWIDRDGDDQYGPCGGLAGGLDAISGRFEDVRIVPDRVVEPGGMALDLADCDLDTAALRGSLRVAVEPGAIGSGRPARLDLIDPRGDRFSVQLVDNHTRLAAEPSGERVGPFAVTVDAPPGRYRGVVYLDSDRDGAFGSCETDPFADRAVVDGEAAPALAELRVGPGQVLDLGELALATLPCPVPDTGLTPTVILSGDIEPPNRPVRLRIEEQGGFVDDVLLIASLDEAERPISAARRPLAPGVYRLTAYVDANGNGAYDDCDSEDFDTPSARVDVSLDAMDAELAPRFLLGAACGG